MKQLSGLDAMFLHSELDGFPQHIGGVGIYDQSSVPGGKVRFKQILQMLAATSKPPARKKKSPATRKSPARKKKK